MPCSSRRPPVDALANDKPILSWTPSLLLMAYLICRAPTDLDASVFNTQQNTRITSQTRKAVQRVGTPISRRFGRAWRSVTFYWMGFASAARPGREPTCDASSRSCTLAMVNADQYIAQEGQP